MEKVRVNPYTDALIIVDVQNDFCPGGALAVPGGDEVVPVINRLIPLFQHRIASQDWHPRGHISFTEQGGQWPSHCVQGTLGAALHADLAIRPFQDTAIVQKGFEADKEAYSAFQGTLLTEYLEPKGVTRVFVCGLAFDFCVASTAYDAHSDGFETFVVLDATRSIFAGAVDMLTIQWERDGIHSIDSSNMVGYK